MKTIEKVPIMIDSTGDAKEEPILIEDKTGEVLLTYKFRIWILRSLGSKVDHLYPTISSQSKIRRIYLHPINQWKRS